MLITMIETRRGSEDGHTVRQFIKGSQYSVADTLARQFLNRGWAYNSEPGEDETHPDGKFSYNRGTDGCDSTWDISYPDGTHLVSIHFWERADETEAEAKMIVDALNAYGHTK
jgi:hypothetical protein